MKGTEQEIKKPVRMDVRTIMVHLKGTTPLIVHKWSEKSKEQIRAKQQKVPRGAKEARDPAAEYEAARYRDDTGNDVFPCIGIKCAIVDAASFTDDVTKVLLRGSVFVKGTWARIISPGPRMGEDVVKIGMGTSDLRYRPYYDDWSMDVAVEYDSAIISQDQLLDLVRRAGFSIGIGEWRPQKDGQSGRFVVEVVG